VGVEEGVWLGGVKAGESERVKAGWGWGAVGGVVRVRQGEESWGEWRGRR